VFLFSPTKVHSVAAIKRCDMGTCGGKAQILIVDDHPIVREGLVGLINRQRDMSCGAGVGTIADAQTARETKTIDLLLLDLRMGSSDGLENIKSFKARFPDVPILVVSQFDEGTYAERALRAGARGYVMKEQATEEVLNAIRQVLTGGLYFSLGVARLAVERMLEAPPAAHDAGLSALSDRELHVFKAIGAGKSTRQIAAELNLSVKTIETYREHIKYKLNLSSGAELIERAKRAAQREAPAATPKRPSAG
jgi:DNA-binding NarL/FixJ family response regulator